MNPTRKTHYGLYKHPIHGGGLISLHPTKESADKAAAAGAFNVAAPDPDVNATGVWCARLKGPRLNTRRPSDA